MSSFTIETIHSAGYDQKVETTIRLIDRPTREDYQKILNALDVLSEMAEKYIKQTKEADQ